MSHANCSDLVAHHVQGVYEEFLSRWPREPESGTDNPTDNLNKSSVPPTRNGGRAEAVKIGLQHDSHVESSLQSPSQQKTKEKAITSIVTASSQNETTRTPQSNDSESSDEDEDEVTVVIHRSPPAISRPSPKSKPASTKQDRRRDLKRKASGPKISEPKTKPNPSSRRSIRSRGTLLQRVEDPPHPSPQPNRRRTRSQYQIPNIDNNETELFKTPANQRQTRSTVTTESKRRESELGHETRSKTGPRKSASTPIQHETSNTSKRITTVNKTPLIDPEEATRARISRKRQREAAEQAIVDQQVAKLRVKEAGIRKCYYCWHYSQSCNLKIKPKCIPCHKNRRSCFGSYSRMDFCKTYEERTGKVHKQALKDNIKYRSPSKRKGHHNKGRKSARSTYLRPQRLYLNDNQRKCYRCWDRSLACDLETPKCSSCVKGRSACFGFRSTRAEFCEIFEEETGEKHRWASFLDPKDPSKLKGTRSDHSTVRRSRAVAYDNDTSDSSETDGWNSDSSDLSELTSDDELEIGMDEGSDNISTLED